MKKVINTGLSLLLAMIIFCSPVFAEQKDGPKKVYTIAKYGLNIRSMPNTKHERVDVVPYGTELDWICEVNGGEWSCVLYDGRLRFVYNDYIQDEEPEPLTPDPTPEPVTYYDPNENASYSASGFMSAGVINWGGYRWTWYSERVLPGGGLDIPGRHTDANGYVRDGSGFLCIASGSLSKGTIVPTPFGSVGKVYDYCGTPGTLDVYVNW